LVLDLQASVMYEKPQISDISYTVTDSRREGGVVVLEVVVQGDVGLSASFDVSPGIVEGAPMSETEDGRYVGKFPFPSGVVGGPYTVIGRLRHERAGEVILRDPNPLTITLSR
jgi:hypothetical protein